MNRQILAAAICELKAKRKSRIWFGDDVDYLNALGEAEKSLERVVGYLIRDASRKR